MGKKKQKNEYPPLRMLKSLGRLSPDDYGRGMVLDWLKHCGQKESAFCTELLERMGDEDFNRYLANKQEFLNPDASAGGQILNAWMLEMSGDILTEDVKNRITILRSGKGIDHPGEMERLQDRDVLKIADVSLEISLSGKS